MVRDGVGFVELADVAADRALRGTPYLEFLRVSSMSAGLYALPAGSRDGQLPHRQDELYYVVRGKARMRAGTEDRSIGPGTLVFVAASVEHRFYQIEEDLEVLVFFPNSLRRRDGHHGESSLPQRSAVARIVDHDVEALGLLARRVRDHRHE
jgi:quercetin dioxygenase-like cupin family protein